MSLAADRALIELARRQCGLATWRQARDGCGVPDSTIKSRLERKIYGTLRPGVLVLPGVVMNHVTRTMGAVLWAGDGAIACCFSAAALHRLWDRPFPPRVHVLVPTTRRRPLPGLEVHRSDIVPEEDRVIAQCVPCTSVTRTIVDLSGVLDEAELELLVLDAVRRRLTSFVLLRECADRLRRSKGLKLLRGVIAAYEDQDVERLASILEAESRALVRHGGLPPPVINRHAHDGDGGPVARVDLRWEWARLTVEVDGLRFHSTRAQKRYDDRRQDGLVVSDERVLRYDLYALRHERDRVIREIRTLLFPSLDV